MNDQAALKTVKVVHTVAWAVLVACILAIPWASWRGYHGWVAVLAGTVLLEVAVLVFNGWRCPLTIVAERYTTDRRDNFDIYLPAWLAGRTKPIFGPLFAGGVVLTAIRWATAAP